MPLGLASLALLLFAFSSYLTHSFLYPTAPLSAIANGSEIGLNIKDFIKVAVDTDNLALHDASGDTAVTPEPSGTLVYGDVNVAVTTNTVRGYSLSVYTQDSSNSMRHQNSSVTDAIAPISSISGYNATTGASDLAGNTWGFRKNNGTVESPSYTNWFAVGENTNNNTIIYDTDTGNSAFCENLSYPLSSTGCDSGTYDTFNINFGAKLTSSLPAGTYTNNVVFSAVAKDEGARYTLDFHPNGGENVMANRTIIKGSTAVLPTNGFSLPGHTIKGWALTQADAEAASTTTSHPTPTSPTYSTYTAGQTVSVNDLITAAIAAGQSVEQNALINLYAIWDIAYTVTYNAGSNGTNIATGSAITNDTILSATITIPGNENDHFTLEGYNFLGWALTDGATDVVYEASDTVSIRDLITAAAAAGQSVTSTASGTINLYGVWEKAITYFQDTGSCATIDVNTTGTLTDSRDEQEYTVYRFRNTGTAGNFDSGYPSGMSGYCIMTKDLSLGYVTGGSVTKGSDLTLTADDSAAAATVIARTSTGNWSADNSDHNLQYINGPQYGNEAYTSHSYYSYGAAQKVCPKGWRLPTQYEYSSIVSFMGGNDPASSARISSEPYNFIYGGGFYSSNGWGSSGSYGRYWSPRDSSSSYGNEFYLSSSGLGVGDSIKNSGISVRCISEPIDGTMQGTVCSSLPEGKTVTLLDSRDSQSYTIYRWPSTGTAGSYSSGYPIGMAGYCIMTRDLSLGMLDFNANISSSKNINDGQINLSPDDSAASAAILYVDSANNGSGWSTDDSDLNLQYTYGFVTNRSHGYYSYGAAQKVCPKNWRLPTNTEYYNIASFMGGNSSSGSANIRDIPYNFIYGDRFSSSGWQMSNGSHIGGYWSSTQYMENKYGYFLSFHSGALTTTNDHKNIGYPVRCIAEYSIN